jgi:hypothetical protein
MGSLAKQVEDSGLRPFTKKELSLAADLFADRAALFLTPTETLPSRYIGHGRLNIWIPIPIPSWLEYFQVPGYRSPRFWVDQIQRATGKIRWRPFRTPYIEFTTYDTYPHGPTFILKAILDALKIKSMGRSDGKAIHYFGPLVDDDCKSYRGYDVIEKRVTNASDIGCRIVITESDKNSAFTIKHAIQYS